jgi:hypothetical protein
MSEEIMLNLWVGISKAINFMDGFGNWVSILLVVIFGDSAITNYGDSN